MTFRSTGSIQYEVRLRRAGSSGMSSWDVTDRVTGIRRFTDTGADTVNTADIEFFSPDGELLTKGTPLIQDYDRFSIECRDLSGKTVFYNVYEFAPREGAMDISETKKGGRRIRLSLLGLEYHLQKVNYVFPHRWQSGDTVARNIIKYYNANKGKDQPEAVYGGGMPTKTRSTYPYDDSPESCYDRLTDLVNSFGAPPAAGGLLDFYTLESVTAADGKLYISMRSLGDNTTNRRSRLAPEGMESKATPETIDAAILDGQDEKDRDLGISPPKATRIIGIFDRQSGSLPTEYSRVRGRDIRHEFLPEHDPDQSYIKGEEVQDGPPDGSRKPAYRCKTDTPAGTALTDASHWERIPHPDYVKEGGVQYSPWTQDKALVWEKSCINPDDLPSPLRVPKAMPDFNLAITGDPVYQRYPVDIALDFTAPGVTPSVPSNLRLENGNYYRGFRVLVVGDGAGDFAGFSDQVAEYTGERWVVKYDFGAFSKETRIVNSYGGNVYSWNPTANRFELSGRTNDYDCLHPFKKIENVQGVYTALDPNSRDKSAIEITYDIPAGLDLFGSQAYDAIRKDVGLFIGYFDPDDRVSYHLRDKRLYNLGCSLRFLLPFPTNSDGIGENVGDLYGGGNKGEPATLDISNNRYTRDGDIGYKSKNGMDLGGIASIGVFIRVKHLQAVASGDSTDLIHFPNTRVRYWFRDCLDNYIIHDSVIPFNSVWHHEEIPINAFIPYLARAPKEAGDFFRIPQEIQPLNLFRYWDVKEWGVTWLDPYDAEGRYDITTESIEQAAGPLGGLLVKPSESIVSALFGRQVKIAIDGFRFNKELVVTSKLDDKSNKNNLEEVIRIPRITTFTEGEYYVESEKERLQFPNKEYVLDLRGRFDIQYGDTFFYKNDKVIRDNDRRPGQDADDAVGQIKLAALGVEHSITSEGLRTRISAIKRFE